MKNWYSTYYSIANIAKVFIQFWKNLQLFLYNKLDSKTLNDFVFFSKVKNFIWILLLQLQNVPFNLIDSN